MEKSSSESTFESTQEFFDLWVKTYQATLGRLVEPWVQHVRNLKN
jgi:hypothetical protein